MKALSSQEIQKLVLELSDLVGAQLQDIEMKGNLLLLKFYLQGERVVLIDFNPQCPMIISLSSQEKVKFKGEKKPLTLFLKANIVGSRLQSIEAPIEFGRVIRFVFGDPSYGERGRIEFRLFPRGQNCLVFANGKMISLKKPMPLKSNLTSSKNLDLNNKVGLENQTGAANQSDVEEQNGNFRNFLQLEREWLANQKDNVGAIRGVAKNSSLDTLLKRKAKLDIAIQKISQGIQEKIETPWQSLGDWLMANQSLQVPKEFSEMIDPKLSPIENANRAYGNAKRSKVKQSASLQRIDELKKIKSDLESGKSGSAKRDLVVPVGSQDKIKGRTLHLANGMALFVGKSASDNLKLLRQAKPWYFWLHLRDTPSAHGILHCAKNQKISQSDWHAVAHFLIEKNFGERASRMKGQNFDLIIAECRHVRPIKGDKLGRVTFSKSRTIRHKFL